MCRRWRGAGRKQICDPVSVSLHTYSVPRYLSTHRAVGCVVCRSSFVLRSSTPAPHGRPRLSIKASVCVELLNEPMSAPAKVLPHADQSPKASKSWQRLKEKLAYPMHVISVPDFLSLDEWLPHQDALSAGLLQEYDHEKMDGRVLFVSHQWSSWLHPDPKLEQMNSLKFALGKLLEGKTEVRSNSILEFSYKWNCLLYTSPSPRDS